MDLTQTKLIMLEEYEKQIKDLFENFFNKNLSLKDFIVYFNKLNNIYKYSRVDIKNQGINSNSVRFIEYDKNVNMSYPNWFKDETGIGCKIEWKISDLNFIFSCINEGKLKFILRGMDFKDWQNKRIPIYSNFKKLSINNNEIFEEDILVWHDKAYIFEKECQSEEIILVELKIYSLFDYFPQFNILLKEDISGKDISLLYEKLINFILLEKSLIKFI